MPNYTIKTIRVGTAADNDYVVDDMLAQPYHLRLNQENAWSCSIIVGTSPETVYINDIALTHDSVLYNGDVLRIGQSVIPWQQWFDIDDSLRPTDEPDGYDGRISGWLAFFMVVLSLGGILSLGYALWLLFWPLLPSILCLSVRVMPYSSVWHIWLYYSLIEFLLLPLTITIPPVLSLVPMLYLVQCGLLYGFAIF